MLTDVIAPGVLNLSRHTAGDGLKTSVFLSREKQVKTNDKIFLYKLL